jgi:hypothetical protein
MLSHIFLGKLALGGFSNSLFLLVGKTCRARAGAHPWARAHQEKLHTITSIATWIFSATAQAFFPTSSTWKVQTKEGRGCITRWKLCQRKYNKDSMLSVATSATKPSVSHTSWAARSHWYVSNVSIIFYAPCLFTHHLLCVLLHFVAFLCIFRN